MTTRAGNYVTSYDAGSKPFKHDTTRGKWSSDWDFYLASISHAFGLANFSLLPVFIMMHGGVFFIIPYLLTLCLFTLPIFFIQSFLGQFSSTGFISVYRISPLFKGIGYVILILNIVSACVNSVTAAYVLTYFFASFSIDLPWMSCKNSWNNANCSEKFHNVTGLYSDFYDISWSTAEYFQFKILNFNDETEGDRYVNFDDMRMAWPIFGSNIVVWITMSLLLYSGMELVTKFIKYSALTIFSILIILFIRFACLPGALEGITDFLVPTEKSVQRVESWIGSPLISVAAFGTGWGTILTMASFNKFKTNIYNQIIMINVTLIVGGILAGFLMALADGYLKEHHHMHSVYIDYNPFSFLFIGFPFLFGTLEASQMWSLMFYLMLTLCELNALIIILLTSMTSLLDEYEVLRPFRKHMCICLPGALFLLSIILTTNHGYELYNVIIRLCGASQMGLCFLEIIVVVWIYGRQRFQRDIEFMLGIPLQTWIFYIIRFLTPLFVLFCMFYYVVISLYESWAFHFETLLVFTILKFLPWIVIPGYIIYTLCTTSGSLMARFRRCIRPNDWYPVDPTDRQRYEDVLGNSDITHQLVNMTVNDEEQCE